MKKGLLIGVCGVAAVLFFIVTLNVINGTLDTWNEHVYSHIVSWRTPMLTQIMIFVSFWEQWFVCLSISELLLIIPKTHKPVGIPIVFVTFSAISLGYVLKRIITIPRPDVLTLIETSGYDHPSGHTTRATVFFRHVCDTCLEARTQKITQNRGGTSCYATRVGGEEFDVIEIESEPTGEYDSESETSHEYDEDELTGEAIRRSPFVPLPMLLYLAKMISTSCRITCSAVWHRT